MSKLTLAIRFLDNTLCSFKVHKSIEFTYFKNILLLDQEINMINFLNEHGYPTTISAASDQEHHDYGSSKSFFAPYDYGIVFIDFIEKQVHSYNDYSAFLEYSTLAFKHEIDSFIPVNHHGISKNEHIDKKEILAIQKNIEHVLNTNSSLSNIGFNIHQALKKNGQIFYVSADKTHLPVLIDSDNTVSLLCKISGMIKPLDYSAPLKIKAPDMIRIIPDGWNIISSDTRHIDDLFNTISTIIPKEQQALWQSNN